MSDHERDDTETFELILKGDGAEWERSALTGSLFIVLGVILVTLHQDSGESIHLVFGLGSLGFGLLEAAYGFSVLWRDAPAFEGNRAGFRVRGGRMRPWGTFHSIRVKDLRASKPRRKIGEVVQVRVATKGLFQYRTIAKLRGVEPGRLMAHDIDTFYAKLRALWIKENNRLDAVAAPGVAARNKALRERR